MAESRLLQLCISDWSTSCCRAVMLQGLTEPLCWASIALRVFKELLTVSFSSQKNPAEVHHPRTFVILDILFWRHHLTCVYFAFAKWCRDGWCLHLKALKILSDFESHAPETQKIPREFSSVGSWKLVGFLSPWDFLSLPMNSFNFHWDIKS